MFMDRWPLKSENEFHFKAIRSSSLIKCEVLFTYKRQWNYLNITAPWLLYLFLIDREQTLAASGMVFIMEGKFTMDMVLQYHLKIQACMLQHMGLILCMVTNNRWA